MFHWQFLAIITVPILIQLRMCIQGQVFTTKPQYVDGAIFITQVNEYEHKRCAVARSCYSTIYYQNLHHADRLSSTRCK